MTNVAAVSHDVNSARVSAPPAREEYAGDSVERALLDPEKLGGLSGKVIVIRVQPLLKSCEQGFSSRIRASSAEVTGSFFNYVLHYDGIGLDECSERTKRIRIKACSGESVAGGFAHCGASPA